MNSALKNAMTEQMEELQHLSCLRDPPSVPRIAPFQRARLGESPIKLRKTHTNLTTAGGCE